MKRAISTAIAVALCLVVGGCYFPDHGPLFPVPTETPRPGDEWATEDGVSGLRLNDDGTATVWGVPFYAQRPVECRSEDFLLLSATGRSYVTFTEDYAEIAVAVVVRHDDTGRYERGLSFYANRTSEGWHVLSYDACGPFNDGRGIDLIKQE